MPISEGSETLIIKSNIKLHPDEATIGYLTPLYLCWRNTQFLLNIPKILLSAIRLFCSYSLCLKHIGYSYDRLKLKPSSYFLISHSTIGFR